MLRPAFRPALRLAFQPALSRVGRRNGGGGAPPVGTASLRFEGTDDSTQETGFRLETSLTGSAPWVVAATLGPLSGSGTGIDQTVSGFAFNTLYYTQIVTERTGFPDNVISAGSIWTKPPLPVTGVSAVATGPTTATVTWTEPATLPASGGYKIYISENGIDFTPAGTVATGVSSFGVTGLSALTAYETRVIAFNDNDPAADAEGAASADVAFTTSNETTPPGIDVVAVDATGLILTITWDEVVAFGAGGNAGFALTASSGAVTASYTSGASSGVLTYGLSRAIGVGESITLAYTQPGNGVEDVWGNDAVTISGVTVANNSTHVNYLISEDFGASLNHVWVASGTGSEVSNYTSAPIDGAASLQITGSSTSAFREFTTPAFTASSTIGIFFAVNPAGSPVITSSQFISILDGSANIIASAEFVTTGQFRINHGSVQSGLAGTYAAATTYWVWLEYTKGTGANGVLVLHVATSTTKPTALLTITNGNATADAVKISLKTRNRAQSPTIYDRVRVAPVAIGSSPP